MIIPLKWSESIMLKVAIWYQLIMCYVLALSLSTTSIAVYAKPDLRPLGANIADEGSAYYQFKTQKFQSADQQRNYQVWLGIPKNHKQNQQSAAIFMLDGNSVMSRLNDTVLKKLSERDAPVLVAIGYQSNLPFESAARSVDYTPADETGKIMPDPRNPERMTGGSVQFRELIIHQIQPWVRQQVALDPQRTALWGHSYGGLFVLDTLLNTKDQSFSHYFSASPSLSWADARILNAVAKTDAAQLQHKKLVVMEGDQVQSQARVSINTDREMIQNNRQLVQDLAHKSVDAKLILYPHLSHGQVFQAALMDVLNNQLF